MTKYQKYLYWIGWICVLIAVLTILTGLFFGKPISKITAATMEAEGQKVSEKTVAIVKCGMTFFMAVMYLILAGMCNQAAKDKRKAKSLRIVTLIALVSSVIDLMHYGFDNIGAIDNWISFAASAVIFFCSGKVRYSY